MKNFWTKEIEYKAAVISSLMTLLVFLCTAVFFWFGRYEIPLAALLGGAVVIASWLLLLKNKKRQSKSIFADIFLIYFRLIVIGLLAGLFAFLQLKLSIIIVSPIFLVVFYSIISLVSLIAYWKKEADNV
ncbi:MAG: hypothetical protein GX813_04915 [Erysipelotrichia bacterium]|nr:hypothetical protein [Erysipelotrichia bacterium]